MGGTEAYPATPTAEWYFYANWIGLDGDGSSDVCQASNARCMGPAACGSRAPPIRGINGFRALQ
jgi:hypothetical protein